MFDMSWGEIMVIGGVALIVIGPKDLPKALRTVGQMTSKVRRMAGEFQSQFSEAMREADLEDVRREVEGLNRGVSSAASAAFNPIQTIRDEIRSSVERPAASSAASLDPALGPDPIPSADLPPVPPVDEWSAGPATTALPEPAPASPAETASAAMPPAPTTESGMAAAFPETQPLVPLPVDEPVLPASVPAPAPSTPSDIASPEPLPMPERLGDPAMREART